MMDAIAEDQFAKTPIYYGPGFVLAWLLVAVTLALSTEWPKDPWWKKPWKLVYLCLACYFLYGIVTAADLYLQLKHLDWPEVHKVCKGGREQYEWTYEALDAPTRNALESAVYTTQNYIRLSSPILFIVDEVGPYSLSTLALIIFAQLYIHHVILAKAMCLLQLDLIVDTERYAAAKQLFQSPRMTLLIWALLAPVFRWGRRKARTAESRLERGEADEETPRRWAKARTFGYEYILSPLLKNFAIAACSGLSLSIVDLIRKLAGDIFGWEVVAPKFFAPSGMRLTELHQAMPLILGCCALGYRVDELWRAKRLAKRDAAAVYTVDEKKLDVQGQANSKVKS